MARVDKVVDTTKFTTTPVTVKHRGDTYRAVGPSYTNLSDARMAAEDLQKKSGRNHIIVRFDPPNQPLGSDPRPYGVYGKEEHNPSGGVNPIY